LCLATACSSQPPSTFDLDPAADFGALNKALADLMHQIVVWAAPKA